MQYALFFHRVERELAEKTREVAGGNVKLMTKLLAFLEMYYPPVDPTSKTVMTRLLQYPPLCRVTY